MDIKASLPVWELLLGGLTQQQQQGRVHSAAERGEEPSVSPYFHHRLHTYAQKESAEKMRRSVVGISDTPVHMSMVHSVLFKGTLEVNMV